MSKKLLRTALITCLGLFFCLFLLEWKLRATPDLIQPPVAKAEALRILALGDSITMGIPGGSSYSKELQRALEKMNLTIPVQVINRGVSGLEAIDVYRQLDEYLNMYSPHIVITMLGHMDTVQKLPDWIRELRLYRLYLRARARWILPKISDSNLNSKELNYYKHVLETGEDKIEYSRLFGAILRRDKRYMDAISAHLKVIEKFPQHGMANLELGHVYEALKKYNLAEKYYRLAIAKSRLHTWAYYLGSQIDSENGVLDREIIARIEKHTWSRLALAMFLERRGEFSKAIAVSEESLRKDPKPIGSYEYLAHLHKRIGNLKEATSVLLRALARYKESARLHEALANLYRGQNKHNLARRHMKLGKQLRAKESFTQSTNYFYAKISRAIQERGILHAVMQYPLRPVSHLRSLLGADNDLLLYIDNERIFREALSSGKYEDFFIDNFGGEFGHMTERANRLMAQNIAAYLNPWFRRRGLRKIIQ